MTDATYEMRPLASLSPDPANRELFDSSEGAAFADLVQSIAEHGLINPITVRPDGTIIAGEDRWRAAQAAGLVQVWVGVRVVDEAEAEVLRIEENLRRKDLKPAQRARAIRRLRERSGPQKRGRKNMNDSSISVAELAQSVGMDTTTFNMYNTIADLIAPLAALLDAGTIGMQVAYQLAQLPAEHQESIAASLSAAELRQEQTVKDLKKALERLTKEVERLTAQVDSGDPERVRREKQAEIDRLRRQTDEEIARAKDYAAAKIAQLEKERAVIDGWQRKDPVNKTLLALNDLGMLDVERAAVRMLEHKGLGPFVALHLQIIDLCGPWLQDYAAALRRALGLPAPDEAVPMDIRRARAEKIRHDMSAALSAERNDDGD